MSDDTANADPYMYNGFSMDTPTDIQLRQTHEHGIHHPLGWGSSARLRFHQSRNGDNRCGEGG